MRSLILLLIFAQPPPSVQQLVESLYPKNARLKQIRMPDPVHQMVEGSRVAGVGSGSGELSVILSRAAGSAGTVWYEDIRAAGTEIKRQHVKQVVLVKGAADDAKLPAGALDAVLIENAYHEIPQNPAMLARLRESLEPAGRLVIPDNRPNRIGSRPREKQANNHVLSADLAAGEITTAGFRIVTRDHGFLNDPDQESAHGLIVAEPARKG
jgi:ubiquinone/menaquinone biosynthesis C-methylase UbiE